MPARLFGLQTVRWWFGVRPEIVRTKLDLSGLGIDDAKYHTVHEGTDYWFCAPGCLRAFTSDSQTFLAST